MPVTYTATSDDVPLLGSHTLPPLPRADADAQSKTANNTAALFIRIPPAETNAARNGLKQSRVFIKKPLFE